MDEKEIHHEEELHEEVVEEVIEEVAEEPVVNNSGRKQVLQKGRWVWVN